MSVCPYTCPYSVDRWPALQLRAADCGGGGGAPLSLVSRAARRSRCDPSFFGTSSTRPSPTVCQVRSGTRPVPCHGLIDSRVC